jgi:uncharacterized protein (DUF302 family)
VLWALGDNANVQFVVSASGYGDTLLRLLAAIEHRGLTVFAQIDHVAAARAVGLLELADEVVVVFGNPRAGTPVMQQGPRIGIEFPLRILVWDNGQTASVGYIDPGSSRAESKIAVGWRQRLGSTASLVVLGCR